MEFLWVKYIAGLILGSLIMVSEASSQASQWWVITGDVHCRTTANPIEWIALARRSQEEQGTSFNLTEIKNPRNGRVIAVIIDNYWPSMAPTQTRLFRERADCINDIQSRMPVPDYARERRLREGLERFR